MTGRSLHSTLCKRTRPDDDDDDDDDDGGGGGGGGDGDDDDDDDDVQYVTGYRFFPE